MKFVFSGKYRKYNEESIIFDCHGRCFSISDTVNKFVTNIFTPKNLIQIYETTNLDKCEIDDILKWLIKNKMVKILLDNNENEKYNIIYNVSPKMPISYAIYPTYKCNQKCIFCYTNSGPSCTTINDMNINQWKKIIRDIIDNGGTSLTILGGEPMLNESLLLEIIDICNNNIYVRIFTNGNANGGISKELAKKISNYPDVEIIFSVHGDTAKSHDSLVGVKGSFETLFESADKILKLNNNIVSGNVAVTNKNVGSLCKIVELLDKKGFMSIDFKPFSPSGKVKDFLTLAPSPILFKDEVLKIKEYINNSKSNMVLSYPARYVHDFELKKDNKFLSEASYRIGGCLGDKEAIINHNGDVYRCPHVIGKQKYCLGNIKEKSIKDIWINIKWPYERNKEWNSDPVCNECKYFEICNGGCSYLSEYVFGTLENGDPYCPKIFEKYGMKKISN